MPRIYLALLLCCGWGVLGYLAAIAQEPPRAANPPTALTPARPTGRPGKFVGSASCASTACHGSVQPDRSLTPRGPENLPPIRRDEYVRWIENDPHARAAQVLGEETSLRMFVALGVMELPANSRDFQQARIPADPEKRAAFEKMYDRCARCHDQQQARGLRPDLPGDPQFTDANYHQGVGCEMCHGAAGRWLDSHYRVDFVGLSPTAKAARGLVDTGRLDLRARMCVNCHVGGAAEVDHDLIAAGHPMMKFELAAYMAMLPAHWKRVRERSRYGDRPDHELQLWLLGQIETARAALLQLQTRAAQAQEDNRNDAPTRWPELAESNCFACHHDLGPAGWRQNQIGDRLKAAGRTLVTAEWNGWNTWLLRQLMPQLTGQGEAAAASKALNRLAAEMNGAIIPNEQKAQTACANAITQLERWAERVADPGTGELRQNQQNLIAAVLAVARQNRGADAIASWDNATQTYLALKAVQQTRIAASPQSQELATADKLLTAMRDDLKFPQNMNRKYHSPRQFEEREPNAASVRDAFLEKMLQVVRILENPQVPR